MRKLELTQVLYYNKSWTRVGGPPISKHPEELKWTQRGAESEANSSICDKRPGVLKSEEILCLLVFERISQNFAYFLRKSRWYLVFM